MKWKPIKQAPVDGTIIIVKGFYDRNCCEIMIAASARFHNNSWWRDNSGYGFTVSCNPTHFIHIPKD